MVPMLLAPEHMNDKDNVFCATFHRDLSHHCTQALLLALRDSVPRALMPCIPPASKGSPLFLELCSTFSLASRSRQTPLLPVGNISGAGLQWQLMFHFLPSSALYGNHDSLFHAPLLLKLPKLPNACVDVPMD